MQLEVPLCRMIPLFWESIFIHIAGLKALLACGASTVVGCAESNILLFKVRLMRSKAPFNLLRKYVRVLIFGLRASYRFANRIISIHQRPPKRCLRHHIGYGLAPFTSVASLHGPGGPYMDAPSFATSFIRLRLTHYPNGYPLGGKWGVWGEGSEAAGSPHSYSAIGADCEAI